MRINRKLMRSAFWRGVLNARSSKSAQLLIHSSRTIQPFYKRYIPCHHVPLQMFLVWISIKKGGGREVFFSYLLFPIACFRYTVLPSPRDKLELLGQILIKRNIRFWLNTSLFSFDTHKGLTVKIYIILVCTQQQWALHILIFDIIRTHSFVKKRCS